jgi:hypothetical protein
MTQRSGTETWTIWPMLYLDAGWREPLYECFDLGVKLIRADSETADTQKRRKLDALLGEFLPVMLEPTDEVRGLAEAYHSQGAIPPAKTLDALHVAMATANDIDALVSWNYRHLVNVWRETRINAVNAVSGYRKPLRIVTPPEVMEDEVQ